MVVREDSLGDKRLVAYVVPAEGRAVEAEHLRARVQRTLPEYMIPAHFVLLEHLPLTANGKVDRKALPAPDTTRSEVSYVAPRTATEEKLAAIWAEVLKVDKVGIHDNFFELGGHSLLATRVISRMRSEHREEYPLRLLFEFPRLEDLAHQFERLRDDSTQVPSVAIAPAPRDGELLLSFAQQHQYQPGNALYNIPLAIKLKGELDALIAKRGCGA